MAEPGKRRSAVCVFGGRGAVWLRDGGGKRCGKAACRATASTVVDRSSGSVRERRTRELTQQVTLEGNPREVK